MKKTVMTLSLLAFAGCFTIFESEYPAVEMTAAGNADVKVQISGFEASVTTYEVLYGYETSYRYHHYYGRRHSYGYWGPSTVMTETYVPQTRMTSAYIDRATEILELNGFNPKTEKPEYRIEVKFGGPFVSDSERAAEAAWNIFSLLTADYGVHTWTAKLKIYDVASGKLLMHHDYSGATLRLYGADSPVQPRGIGQDFNELNAELVPDGAYRPRHGRCDGVPCSAGKVRKGGVTEGIWH